MPMLTRPETLPSSRAISSLARSMSVMIGASRSASASPAGVSDTPWAARSNKRLPKRLFEFRDLHAQGGLNDVELARGARHVSLAGKAEEIVHLLEIHDASGSRVTVIIIIDD